jgi:cell wall-associated NlpC family hydrolase
MDPLLIASAAGDRRVRRIVVCVIAGVAVLTAVVLLAATSIFGSLMSAGTQALISDAASYCIPPAATQAAWDQWSAGQITDAATIIRVGQSDNVPQYGWIIAVAAAMQESRLVNLDYGTSDSLGLFQQRPSQGWGTPAQVMDPVYASGQFYAHLLAVPGWQQLPLTDAAQAVQRSGFPGAYAQWQAAATSLVAHITGAGTAVLAAAAPGTGNCSPGAVAAGAPAQVRAVLAYAYSALGTMYFYGGTCTNPHGLDVLEHCDCSSLVQQSFVHGAGLQQFPRTAEAQWQWGEAGHAVAVPLSQAQIGDVVYFPSYLGPNTIGHTGIVTDPATMTMIEAPQTGMPVKFGSYNPSGLPYGTHLFTILRFLTTTRSGA